MFSSEVELPKLGARDSDSDLDTERDPALDWRKYTVPELIGFMDEIRAVLPPLSLDEVDVEEEMMLQYQSLRALQTLALNDKAFPLNQRVQLANSVGTLVTRMAELQVSVYTSERLKRIEKILARTLKDSALEQKQAFLDEYRVKIAEIK